MKLYKKMTIRITDKTFYELLKLSEVLMETKSQVLRRLIEERFLKEGFKHGRNKKTDISNRS